MNRGRNKETPRSCARRLIGSIERNATLESAERTASSLKFLKNCPESLPARCEVQAAWLKYKRLFSSTRQVISVSPIKRADTSIFGPLFFHESFYQRKPYIWVKQAATPSLSYLKQTNNGRVVSSHCDRVQVSASSSHTPFKPPLAKHFPAAVSRCCSQMNGRIRSRSLQRMTKANWSQWHICSSGYAKT